jgi:hypothetical protein
MRYLFLVLSFLLINITCWGDLSPSNELLYKESWKKYGLGQKNEAIQICQKVLENEKTCNVDKLHFYMTTYIFTGDMEYRKRFDELYLNKIRSANFKCCCVAKICIC